MEPPQDQRPGPCPSDRELLCASSGELPQDELQTIQQHLKVCADCRTKTREMLRLLQLCALYFEDLHSPTQRLERREHLTDLMDAARADRAASAPRRWLAVAAVVFALITGTMLFRNDRVAYADEVVARAAQREHTFAVPADQWRFHVIPSGGGPAAAKHDASPSGLDGTSLRAQVMQLLQEHGFDSQHPLSLVRLQAWRASQPDRRDRVTRENRWLVVRSDIERGRLRQVELVLDATSFQVVKQTWMFVGVGQVVCERIRLVESPRDSAPAASRPEVTR